MKINDSFVHFNEALGLNYKVLALDLSTAIVRGAQCTTHSNGCRSDLSQIDISFELRLMYNCNSRLKINSFLLNCQSSSKWRRVRPLHYYKTLSKRSCLVSSNKQQPSNYRKAVQSTCPKKSVDRFLTRLCGSLHHPVQISTSVFIILFQLSFVGLRFFPPYPSFV